MDDELVLNVFDFWRTHLKHVMRPVKEDGNCDWYHWWLPSGRVDIISKGNRFIRLNAGGVNRHVYDDIYEKLTQPR